MLHNACVTHNNSAVIYLSNYYPRHMPFGHNINGVSPVSNTLKGSAARITLKYFIACIGK